MNGNGQAFAKHYIAFHCPVDDTRPRFQQPKIETFLLETQQHDGIFFFCKYYNQRKHSLAILHCQAVLLLVESDVVGLNFCHPTMARSKPNGLDLGFISFLFIDFLNRIIDYGSM